MKPFVRLLVALALVGWVATACGGREDAGGGDAPAETAEAPAPAETARAAGDSDSSDFALTPDEAERLSRVRQQFAAKRPKKLEITRIESSDGAAIELPADFPSDIPVYPGSVPTRYVAGEATGTMAVFETDETVDAARRFASNALTNEGWSITSDMSRGEMTMMTAEKDGRSLSVAILNDGTNTKITTIEEN